MKIDTATKGSAMRKALQSFVVIGALALTSLSLSGCDNTSGSSQEKSGSQQAINDAQQLMKDAIESANALLNSDGEPYDEEVKDALKSAIKSADSAKDDAAYAKVTSSINDAIENYEKSVKQNKNVTAPEESFLMERLRNIETITDIEAATEDNDPNNLMNKPRGYRSFILMKSSLVNDEFGYYAGQTPVEAGTSGGAGVEVFLTPEEATARDTYLTAFDGNGILSPGSHTVVGTLVVRTSNELTATQQKELEEKIIAALLEVDD